MLRVADCVSNRVCSPSTADRMAAHPKSDRPRVYLCGGGLRKRIVNWSSRPIGLPCFIDSKLKTASLNGDLTDFFITGLEWLVVESTLEITKRELVSLVWSPRAGENENIGPRPRSASATA
jgi:hypothetical protein